MDTIFAREVLASPTNTRGSKYDPDYTYILTNPVNVSRKRSKGFKVLVESVEGSAGETFVLMGLAPPPKPAVVSEPSRAAIAAKTEAPVGGGGGGGEVAQPTADSLARARIDDEVSAKLAVAKPAPKAPVDPPKFTKKVEGLSKYMKIPEGEPVKAQPTVVVKPSVPAPKLAAQPKPKPEPAAKPKPRKPSIFRHGKFKSGGNK